MSFLLNLVDEQYITSVKDDQYNIKIFPVVWITV